ncbi:DUF1254 domain-containing protein [Rhizobium sp. ARZ01]|uniref:DUF1254 domain-containing protein n=1 Tax=Rhizobium sp. ARZ01 TaxID=2769313 RepID=UPI001785F63F|nr:DUF1254 domain-containing protein [Rhizobium sp. ARZ01]MBD9371498.1 DUF1254 domain-containing protein [Rhizobium sp. ARZ01]
MRSVLFAVLIGLLGAAALHILIILAVPGFTGNDAYTRIAELGEPQHFYPLRNEPMPGNGPINDDPGLRIAVCAFSIAEHPVRLFAPAGVPFWSIGLFDSSANEVFSMNDRTAVSRALDVVVATPIQLNAIRKALPDDLSRSILVEMTDEDGYAVLRTFVPTATMDEAARSFLGNAGCEPIEDSAE